VKELPSPLDPSFVLPCVRAEPFAIVTVAGFDEGLRVKSSGIILLAANIGIACLRDIEEPSRDRRAMRIPSTLDARETQRRRFLPCLFAEQREKHAPLSIATSVISIDDGERERSLRKDIKGQPIARAGR